MLNAERERLRSAAVPVVRVQTSAVGLALVEALIGYEWLLSALNKMLSPAFRSGLAGQLKMAMAGNPNGWWVALTKAMVLPHAQLWAVLAEVGELLVALGFFAGAALWASGRFPAQRWARRVNLVVIGALLGSAVMTANYYLMAGATLPGLDPSNPFNEGLSIDGLLTLIALGLLLVHAAPLWQRSMMPMRGLQNGDERASLECP
jgi:thiosulfate dehydrogenase [quinone] large subunit